MPIRRQTSEWSCSRVAAACSPCMQLAKVAEVAARAVVPPAAVVEAQYRRGWVRLVA